MQGQDVLTCPTIANNHQKTSIGGFFLLDINSGGTSDMMVDC